MAKTRGAGLILINGFVPVLFDATVNVFSTKYKAILHKHVHV